MQFRDTAFRSVSDLTPRRWGRLLQAATALELETRLPKLRSMRVRSGQRADASLSGVARLHFRRVQEGGVASLRVEPGIPALVEGFEPAWPAVTYAFDFSGRLNETGHVDLTLNLRGMRFPTPLSAVRILEWDGASYQDITMRVDEHARTITGRTRRMARVVVLARTDGPR
jgi:hypothetical protein